MKTMLYTPTEIVQRNPILARKHWTAQNIGQLLAMQLISGKRGRVALVDESSVLRLFYTNFPSLLQPSPLA